MLSTIARSLTRGVLTEANPFDVRRAFGFPVIDFSRCVACDECARACPTGAIETSAVADGRRTVTLSHAACIQCRECVGACPEQAVSVSHEVEVAAYTRGQLARDGIVRRRSGDGPRHARAGARASGADAARVGRTAARADSRPSRAFAARAAGGRRQLQRVRAGNRRGGQSALRPRALRHSHRRQSAARRRAAGHRTGDAQHGDRAATDLRGGAGSAHRRGGGCVRMQRRHLRRRARMPPSAAWIA